jgi:hypothetical protein
MMRVELNSASFRMLSNAYCRAYEEEGYRLMGQIQHIVDLRLNNSYDKFSGVMKAIIEEYRGTREEGLINILYKNHVQKR